MKSVICIPTHTDLSSREVERYLLITMSNRLGYDICLQSNENLGEWSLLAESRGEMFGVSHVSLVEVVKIYKSWDGEFRIYLTDNYFNNWITHVVAETFFFELDKVYDLSRSNKNFKELNPNRFPTYESYLHATHWQDKALGKLPEFKPLPYQQKIIDALQPYK